MRYSVQILIRGHWHREFVGTLSACLRHAAACAAADFDVDVRRAGR
jgi:UDP-2,3-diacylglucosamine pyrophosphatase LpxH